MSEIITEAEAISAHFGDRQKFALFQHITKNLMGHKVIYFTIYFIIAYVSSSVTDAQNSIS